MSRPVLYFNLILEIFKIFVPLIYLVFLAGNWYNLVTIFMLLYSVFGTLQILGIVIWAKRKFSLQTYWNSWNRDHREALTFLLPSVSQFLLPKFLLFLCGSLFTAELTGQFSVALLAGSVFSVIWLPLQTAFMRYFQIEGAQRNLKSLLNRLLRYQVIGLFAIALLTFVIGWFFIPILFKADLALGKIFLPIIILIAALDALRMLWDVIWTKKLGHFEISVLEMGKISGIILIFFSFSSKGLSYCLWMVAALLFVSTAYKGFRLYLFGKHN